MALLWDAFDDAITLAQKNVSDGRCMQAFKYLRIAQAEFHAISGKADMYDKYVDPEGRYPNTWRGGLNAKGALLFEVEKEFAQRCLGGDAGKITRVSASLHGVRGKGCKPC